MLVQKFFVEKYGFFLLFQGSQKSPHDRTLSVKSLACKLHVFRFDDHCVISCLGEYKYINKLSYTIDIMGNK